MSKNRHGCVLAEIPQFGSVFDCGSCGNIHVTVGPVSLVLAPADYMRLVTMIHTSASAFESWLEARRHISPYRNERLHEESDADTEAA